MIDEVQCLQLEGTVTKSSTDTVASTVFGILQPIEENHFGELVELGIGDVVEEWWIGVIEAFEGGLISRELALQQLFELSHIESIVHLQEDRKKLARIRQIIGRELPPPGWHMRELLDELIEPAHVDGMRELPRPGWHVRELLGELIEPAHVDGMRELHTNASEKYYAPYVSWRHSMNEGPLAVGLRTVFDIVDTFPGIYHQDERKSEIVEKLRIIETGLSPVQFANGDMVDWNIWEPDFSTWDEESNSWGLQQITDPEKKARLQQEDWRYKISES